MYDESFAAKIAAFMQKMKANVSEEQAKKYQEGISKKDAENKLKELLLRKSILKRYDGIEAFLSNGSLGKLVSEKSVRKSLENGFTRPQHYAVASDIENLFKNSITMLVRADKNNDPNIAAIHRLVAPIYGDNAAFITIKESTRDGKRLYSVELIELGKLECKLATDLTPTARASSNPTHNIQKNS